MNMKRFDDFIRLLLGILISELFRKADDISEGLERLFDSGAAHPGVIASVTPYVLIILYLRNIHASMLYDRNAEKSGHQTWLERTNGRRSVVMLLSLLGLFAIPYATAHLLTEHLAAPNIEVKLPLLLLGPIALYFLWDFLIVVGESNNRTRQLDAVVARWLRIEAWGASTFVIAAVVTMWGINSDKDVPPELLLGIFIVVVLATVLTDYVWNCEFYFSPAFASSTVPAQPGVSSIGAGLSPQPVGAEPAIATPSLGVSASA